MIQVSDISNDHLIRALRVYVDDLNAKYSPFNKSAEYFHELSGWIACAATRIETLSEGNFMSTTENYLQIIQAVVDAQADNSALWLDAITAPEAYLQHELRQLHACIERYTKSKDEQR